MHERLAVVHARTGTIATLRDGTPVAEANARPSLARATQRFVPSTPANPRKAKTNSAPAIRVARSSFRPTARIPY